MKRRKSLLYRLRHALLGLVLLSAYQYHDLGRITWHLELLAKGQDYIAEWVPALSGGSDAAGRSGEAEGRGPELLGRALSVRDGDTFILRAGDRSEYRIRLHGIDAPESNQPHGSEATRALARRIEGRDVRVRVEDVDQYGRQVGTVFHDGENVNLLLVREGHAWWYQQYARADRDLAEAEEGARTAKIGLWVQRNPVEPWVWRRNR